VVPILLVM